MYNTNGDGALGYSSKVSFGGNSYGGGDVTASSIQDAEQRSAYAALVGLGVLGSDIPYNSEGMSKFNHCFVQVYTTLGKMGCSGEMPWETPGDKFTIILGHYLGGHS